MFSRIHWYVNEKKPEKNSRFLLRFTFEWNIWTNDQLWRFDEYRRYCSANFCYYRRIRQKMVWSFASNGGNRARASAWNFLYLLSLPLYRDADLPEQEVP